MLGRKLVAEVDDRECRPPTYDTLKRLRYLRAVLDESKLITSLSPIVSFSVLLYFEVLAETWPVRSRPTSAHI